MKQTELEAKYLKNKTGLISYKTYKKQRNFCGKLYKKVTKKYDNKLNINSIIDNKEEFWRAIFE